MQKLINIEAKTLSDSWFQLVYSCLDNGRKFKIDEGSFAGEYRYEFDWVQVHIEQPWLRDVDGLPLIPEFPEASTIHPPVAKDYIAKYAPYIMEDEKEKGEAYTYGQRIRAAKLPIDIMEEMINDGQHLVYKPTGNFIYSKKSVKDNIYDEIDQVDTIIDTYKRSGHRNNQMCMSISQPTDVTLLDPPCLRSIDTRIQDGRLHFYIYFRSWDLWSGYPANLAGISLLQEYMANEIGVKPGEFICTSKGLHLYAYTKDIAELRCNKYAEKE